MPQPTTYDRQYNFADYQAENPSDPLPGDEVDNELNAVKLTLDETLANLELIQRDDGQLANETVGYDQLKEELILGFNTPTNWATATAYEERDTVFRSNLFYICLVDHTSGVFATDLAAAKWLQLADLTAIAPATTASAVTNSPSGGISSTNVQAALNELDTEKANLASPTFTGTVTIPTLAVTTAASVAGLLTAQIADAGTTTVVRPLVVAHSITGTAANGSGVGLEFQTEDNGGALEAFGRVDLVTTDVTAASEDAYISLQGRAGGTIGEGLRVYGTTALTGSYIRDSVLPNGAIVDRAHASYATYANSSTAIPFDDTVPTSSEGAEILSASITPKSTTNRLRIWGTIFGGASAIDSVPSVAVFTTAGGVNAVWAANNWVNGQRHGTVTFPFGPFEYVPGTLSTQTVSVRVGPNATGTFYFNGSSSARIFGGVGACLLVVEEIKA